MSEQMESKRKRQPILRSIEEQEESDDYWKNNKYFKEEQGEQIPQIIASQDEDKDDYDPNSNSISISDSDSNNDQDGQDEFVDSQQDDEDQWESDDNKSIPVDDPPISLLKLNLSEYSFMRGIHHQTLIQDIPRLGHSSYIFYEDGQHFKPSPFLNRNLLGVPHTGKGKGYDEQALTKTDFHHDLFRFEDMRYEVDKEIKYLKFMIRQIEDGKYQNVDYQNVHYQNVDYQHYQNDDSPVQRFSNRLQLLYQKRTQSLGDEEASLFRQSLDEQYFLKKQAHLLNLTPRGIQEELNRRLQQTKLFQVDTALSSRLVMEEWQREYREEQTAPTLTLQFDSDISFTLDLVRMSISLEKISSDSEFMRDVFDEIAFGFFQNNPNQSHQDLSQVNLDELFQLSHFKNTSALFNDYSMKQITTQKLKGIQNPFNFFPYDTNTYLFGRPVLSYLFYALHKVHQAANIIKIRTNQVINCSLKEQNITLGGIKYSLLEVVVEIIFRSLKSKISSVKSQDFMRLIFNDDDAIIIQGLISVLFQIRRILFSFQYDNISIQFFLLWICGLQDSKMAMKFQDLNNKTQEQLLDGLTLQLKNEKCGLCRVERIDSLVVVHSFDISRQEDMESKQSDSNQIQLNS